MRHLHFLITGILVGGLTFGLAWGSPSGEKVEKQIVALNSVKSQSGSSLKKSTESQASAINTPEPIPVYKPPRRGAPGGRVGGGTRGDYDIYMTVYVLAPGEIRGLTSQDQPDLYWYISKPCTAPIVFTLIDEEATDPLIETRLESPIPAGVHSIQLSDYGVRLSPDKMYRWSVAVVLDSEHRSKDIMASARIQRALPSEVPHIPMEQSDAVQQTLTNAEAGLWYDAIGTISKAISTSPENHRFHHMRGALLAQESLNEVAAFDRFAQKSF